MQELMQERINVANEVLRYIARGTRLSAKGKTILVTYGHDKQVTRPWKTKDGQDYYPTWHQEFPYGGTSTIALSQLVRWCQDKPVSGLWLWQRWTGDRIRLAYADRDTVLSLLAGAGYPEHSYCVLCKRQLPQWSDWWNFDDVSGPCCAIDCGCKQIRPEDQVQKADE